MRWFRRTGRAVLVLAMAAGATGQTLETLAQNWRDKPNPASRAALLRFANANAQTAEGALARLALAEGDLTQGRAAEALEGFETVRARLPVLADYAAWGAARSLVALDRKAEAARAAEAVAAVQPTSPYRAWALLVAGRALTESGAAARAVELLRPALGDLPQPQGDFTLGMALDALGRSAEAAALLQQVVIRFPVSDEARQARGVLSRLSALTAPVLLERAAQLLKANQPALAHAELTALVPSLTGADLALARVRLAAALCLQKQYSPALAALSALAPPAGEIDAERLYYAYESARRLDRWDTAEQFLRQLGELYPRSPWRLDALLTAASRHLLQNEGDLYEPLYRACFEAFPDSPRAPFCHWRVAWLHYWRRLPTAPALLAEHIRRYPRSPDTPAALYFLGSFQEQAGESAEARLLWETVTRHFPNYFYAVAARQRLARLVDAHTPPASGVRSWLSAVPLPPPDAGADFNVDAATRLRLDRARRLASAALYEWAELELRTGSKTDSKSAPLALELARISSRRGNPAQALRGIKALAPNHLAWNLSSAPAAFWQFAFPLPYRNALEQQSRTRSLDPYLFASLVRQESEFDPRAVSRARAMGLAQVMPATGRELSRHLGIRRFTPAMLFVPDINLQIGAFYLRRVLDSFDQSQAAALAAYNAGPSRAKAWLAWSEWREPAEFIESIPFSETRNYVQTVLRGADIYQRLYAADPGRVPRAPKPAPKAARPPSR